MRNTWGALAFTVLVAFFAFYMLVRDDLPTEQERRDAKQAACVRDQTDLYAEVCTDLIGRPDFNPAFNACIESEVRPRIERKCGPGSVAAWKRHIDKKGRR